MEEEENRRRLHKGHVTEDTQKEYTYAYDMIWLILGLPKSKLETPHKNTETLIADPRTIYGGNNPAKKVSIHHEPELKGGFLALSQKGLRIKNYREDKPA